jgi:hypothetical protein
MALPAALLDLEDRSIGPLGEPTLGEALRLARDEWHAGSRDRELGLHLLFLSWYCNLEPAHLTGLDERVVPSSTLAALFQEVFATFRPTIHDDPECLYVVGLIAALSPWCGFRPS